MDDQNQKKESLSKEIDHVVVLCFGIAFFLIFTASAILLFITEEDISRYYGKVIGMFVCYLALYIIASFLVIKRIGQLFGPLDRVAHALMREKRYAENGGSDIKSLAESLEAQSEEVDKLARKLENAQSDLDDAHLDSRQKSDRQKETAERLLQDLEQLQKQQEEALQTQEQLIRILKDLVPLENEIGSEREALAAQMQQIEEGLRGSERQQEDAATDFTELGGTFQLLGNMQTDAEELLDTIYNEMTALQSLSAQINLYSMNTALDISRAGSITMSAISALDEIKDLTGKMNAKTDDVLLILIRTRNALKLAIDQSGECREKGEECSASFEAGKTALKEQREGVRRMLADGDKMTEDVGKLSATLHEAGALAEQRKEEQSRLVEVIEKLKADLLKKVDGKDA